MSGWSAGLERSGRDHGGGLRSAAADMGAIVGPQGAGATTGRRHHAVRPSGRPSGSSSPAGSAASTAGAETSFRRVGGPRRSLARHPGWSWSAPAAKAILDSAQDAGIPWRPLWRPRGSAGGRRSSPPSTAGPAACLWRTASDAPAEAGPGAVRPTGRSAARARVIAHPFPAADALPEGERFGARPFDRALGPRPRGIEASSDGRSRPVSLLARSGGADRRAAAYAANIRAGGRPNARLRPPRIAAALAGGGLSQLVAAVNRPAGGGAHDAGSSSPRYWELSLWRGGPPALVPGAGPWYDSFRRRLRSADRRLPPGAEAAWR